LFIYFSYCFLKPHQLLDEKVRELSHQAIDEVLKNNRRNI